MQLNIHHIFEEPKKAAPSGRSVTKKKSPEKPTKIGIIDNLNAFSKVEAVSTLVYPSDTK